MVQTPARTAPAPVREATLPSDYTGYAARALLCKEEGSPADCCLAVIEPGGGGATPAHTHDHDHIFFVIEGAARIQIGEMSSLLTSNQALHVPGATIHSIWNCGDEELRILSINI